MQSRQGLLLEITRRDLAGKNNHLEIYNCTFSSFQAQTSCIPLQLSCTSNTPPDFGLLLQNSHSTTGVTPRYFEVLYMHAGNLLHLDSDILSLHDHKEWGYRGQGLQGTALFTDAAQSQLKTRNWKFPVQFLGRTTAKEDVGLDTPPRKAKTHCRLLCSAGGKLKEWKAIIRAPTEMNGKAPSDTSDAQSGKKK